jgi:hypothetical protein
VQSAGIITATGAAVRVINATKLSVTVPAAVALDAGNPTAQTTADYHVCVYSGTTAGTSPLIAGTAMPYTIGPVADVTGVLPASGPAQGGTVITVSGHNLPADLTATLGGIPLDNINVASDGLSFTAVVPEHAPVQNLTLVVKTASQTIITTSAFSYSNGIVVTPNTAPSGTAAVNVDVTGVGFTGLTWTYANTDVLSAAHVRAATAHVYLVAGEYDATGANANANKVNPAKQECGNVLVVSDVELICTLNLAKNLVAATEAPQVAVVPDGTYTITVVNDGSIIDGTTVHAADITQSIVSSGATFTVADY